MTGKHVPPVSVRPKSFEQLERWKRCAAHYPKLSFSEFVRSAVDDWVQADENGRAADREADRRVRRLGNLTPPEIDRLRARGGDVGDWPELDAPDSAWLDRESDEHDEDEA